MPRVSICLPTLNAVRFLSERIASIRAQTFQDWEVVGVDSHSDDGTWEVLREWAAQDGRVHLHQTPREGIYAGINACIERALGEFVYIATADDTMSPDCLEKMVQALDAHPGCGIVHCGLRIIDEDGRESNALRWEQWACQRFLGTWTRVQHCRFPPHDGILALGLQTVFSSMTQVLVRRTVYDDVGLFQTRWRSIGDLEWQMRAGMVTPSIHIPERLATWREHPAQATNEGVLQTAMYDGLYGDMVEACMAFVGARNPGLWQVLKRHPVTRVYRWQETDLRMRCGGRWWLAARRWVVSCRRDLSTTLAWSIAAIASRLRVTSYRVPMSAEDAVRDALRCAHVPPPLEV